MRPTEPGRALAVREDKPGLWLSHAAGVTPTRMGSGPDEDHLVVLSDAGDPVNIVAFWRDTLPDDARRAPGAPSRRTSSSVPLGFPVASGRGALTVEIDSTNRRGSYYCWDARCT